MLIRMLFLAAYSKADLNISRAALLIRKHCSAKALGGISIGAPRGNSKQRSTNLNCILVPSSQTWGVEMGNSRIVSCPVVVTATISMPSHFRTSAESPAQSSDPWQRHHNLVGRPLVPSGSESVAVGWGVAVSFSRDGGLPGMWRCAAKSQGRQYVVQDIYDNGCHGPSGRLDCVRDIEAQGPRGGEEPAIEVGVSPSRCRG